MKSKSLSIFIATAAASVFSTLPQTTTASSHQTQVKCYGVNACRGKSSCATQHNDCRGHNSCKQKGFVNLTQSVCKQVDGRLTETTESDDDNHET